MVQGATHLTAGARLKLAPVFRDLDSSVRAKIGDQGNFRTLKPSEVLWRFGSRAYELAFVWEGELQVRRQKEGDARVLYRTVHINEVIGFSNAIGRSLCTADIAAGTSGARVLVVPGDSMRSLIAVHPEIAYHALAYLGDLVGRLSDQIERLHSDDLEARLLLRLRTLAEGRREVRVRHQDLADQVGARRESVSRILKSLEDRGIVVCHRGRIDVLARETHG